MLSGLYLNTLGVNAGLTSYDDLLGSSLVSENGLENSFFINIQPTSNSGMGEGTISLDPTTFSSNTSSGTRSGVASPSGSNYRITMNSETLRQSGTIASSSGTVSFSGGSNGSCIQHFHVPVTFSIPFANGQTVNPKKYYAWVGSFGALSNSFSSDKNVNISNFALCDSEGTLLVSETLNATKNRNLKYILGSELLGRFENEAVFSCFLDFDVTAENLDSAISGSISFILFPKICLIKDNYQSMVGTIQSDPKTHELQEESNTIQEETKTTTNNIFDTITSFFGSFFENIKNALVSVFVPDDGYFSSWFTRLNSLLSDKLGVLYFPFEFFISFLERLDTSLNDFADYNNSFIITFPAIEFRNVFTGETYHFLDAQSVDLYDFNTRFNNDYVNSIGADFRLNSPIYAIRTFNCIILSLYLFSLLRKKLSLILYGDERSES